MSKPNPVKGASPVTQPADPALAAPAETNPEQTVETMGAPPAAPVDAPPSESPVAASADSSRPTLADLKKAAYAGGQFEISKAKSWAPDYVPGTGFYVDGSWRRYWVGTAYNDGPSVLEALVTDDRYLVRLV